MIIFTLRRLLLLLITLFLLTFVGFSLSYFTPHAPLQGASLWNAWLFWFEGVLHWDFGVSSINGQLISEQLKEVFPPPWSSVSSPSASRWWSGSPSVCWQALCATNGKIP
jgi:ABC-type antimicrobial peptide transport system permease subunit